MYRITVGISCYKQKEWLNRCLRSLIKQTISLKDFEVIVVNDDPEDDISDVIDAASEYLNIKLINNQKNLGLPASLNKILKKAMGKYFVRVDSDDYVSKHFLYTLSTFLDLNSGPRIMNTNNAFQAVACDYFKVDDVGTLVSRHSCEKEFIACGIMYTYESLANIGFYNESFKMREGHEMIRRYKEKYKLYHLPMPMYKYRIHENQRTNNKEQVEKFDKKLEE